MTGFVICVFLMFWTSVVMAYPVMFAPPTLGPPIITDSGHDFTQSCHVNYNHTDPNAAFTVTWLFDDVIYKTVTLKGGVLVTSLHFSDWRRYFGKKVTCSVESYTTTDPSSRSPYLVSDPYLGELQLPHHNNIVAVGTEVKVTVKSTLPVVCASLPLNRCRVQFHIDIIRGDPKTIFFDGGCVLSLEGQDWDPVEKTVEGNLQISPLVEPYNLGYKRYTFNISVLHQGGEPDGFATVEPFEVQYSYHSMRHSFCIMVGASEMIGMYQSNIFHTSRVGNWTGDLQMYKSKVLEVQTRHWRPVGGSSMVCGVAFQYGGTLIKVDMCSADPSVTAPVLTQGENNPDDVRVYLCGGNYEIVTSDDHRLAVVINADHLDLKLHVPTSSLNGHGACFYRSADSVFSSDYILYTLRRNASESFFDKGADPFFQVSSEKIGSVNYCGCGDSRGDCHPFRVLADPASPVHSGVDGKSTLLPGCSLAVPRTLNPLRLPVEMLSQSGVEAKLTSVEQSDWGTLCDGAIRYHTSDYCITGNARIYNIYLDVCTRDARMTGDVHLNAASAAIGFNWYCQEHTLNANGFYTTDHVTGEHIAPPEVTSDMCSGVCSLAGTCHHGLCACDEGFKGSDCSVNATSEPIIKGVLGGHVCGLSSLRCHNLVLMTRNVYPSHQLDVIVNVTDGLSPPTSIHLEPVYENKYSVSLHTEHLLHNLNLTDNTVIYLNISISSDGVVYSESVTYTIFDDRCRLCGVDQGCLNKEDACHIEGKCYLAFDTNTANNDEICDPDQALRHWTIVHAHSNGPVNNPVPVIGR